MWKRGKHWVDVTSTYGEPFRYCRRSFNADTLNRQIRSRSMLQNQYTQSLNFHWNLHQRSISNSRSVFPLCYTLQTNDDRDNDHHYMKRKLPLRTLPLDENESYRGKLYYRLQQSRCSGTTNTDITKSKSTAIDKNSDTSGNISEPKPSRSTDPAFVSYLTGEIKPQSVLSELTKLSATSILNQRRTAAAKRSRSFALDTNNDKELYRQIVDFQILQKEKSYRKTAYNVNRALIGNIVICTGKFCWKSWTKACLISIFSSHPLPHLASFS